jgi:hypothetical protein
MGRIREVYAVPGAATENHARQISVVIIPAMGSGAIFSAMQVIVDRPSPVPAETLRPVPLVQEVVPDMKIVRLPAEMVPVTGLMVIAVHIIAMPPGPAVLVM